jgi:hypothetical protein
MRRFGAPARVLVVAVSLLVVAASVLAVTASAQSSGPSHRARPFHLEKNCIDYDGGIGAYCTVTSSNVPAIMEGARIFYAQATEPGESLDSDIILYAGRGNTATGHCTLDNLSGIGLCTLFGGTGTLDGFHARVDVSYLGGFDFAWDGTYRIRND